MAAPVYISANEVEELVSVREVIDVLDKALAATGTAEGGVVQPVRTVIPVEKHEG